MKDDNDKHTSGQWMLHDPATAKPSARYGLVDTRIMVLHPDRERVIACCSTGFTSRAGSIPALERLANARLIASAPALLDALDRLLAATVDYKRNNGIELDDDEIVATRHALEVIAAATGEEFELPDDLAPRDDEDEVEDYEVEDFRFSPGDVYQADVKRDELRDLEYEKEISQ